MHVIYRTGFISQGLHVFLYVLTMRGWLSADYINNKKRKVLWSLFPYPADNEWCSTEAAKSNINKVEPSLASGNPTKVRPTEVCCFGYIVWKEFFLGLIDTSLILFQAFSEPKVMFSWEDHINKGYTRKRTPASTASWEGASDRAHTRRLLRQNVQHGHHACARFPSEYSFKGQICTRNVALLNP